MRLNLGNIASNVLQNRRSDHGPHSHSETDPDLSELRESMEQIRDASFRVRGTALSEEPEDRYFVIEGDLDGQRAAELLENVAGARRERNPMGWEISRYGDTEYRHFAVQAQLEEGEKVDAGLNESVNLPGDALNLMLSAKVSKEEIARALGNTPRYTEVYQLVLSPEEAVEFLARDENGVYSVDLHGGPQWQGRHGQEAAASISPLKETADSEAAPVWTGELRIDEEETAELIGMSTIFHPERYQSGDYQVENAGKPLDFYLKATEPDHYREPKPVETRLEGRIGMSTERAVEILDGERVF